MMIDFGYLWDKYRMNVNGVCHCGSNRAQEALIYKKYGINKVIWIEAIPFVFNEMCAYLNSVGCLDEDVTCINACIGEEDGKEVEFHISNNEAQSSSMLELGIHKEIHPSVSYIEHLKMKTSRLDTLLINEDIQDYELLNVDVQGVELEVLKSMGDLLHGFKYAIIEINMRETYIGGALVNEIDEYMAIFDFVRAETGQWVGDTWTDGFYIKKELL